VVEDKDETGKGSLVLPAGPRAKLVIEVDGGQHFSSEIAEYDKVRNEYMAGLGLRVLRFTNTEVLTNIKGVIEVIERNILE